MKYYAQWKVELDKLGLTVDAEGTVTDHLGNACAGEDRFGQAWCKDPRINEITAKGVPAPKPKAKPKKVVEKKVEATTEEAED